MLGRATPNLQVLNGLVGPIWLWAPHIFSSYFFVVWGWGREKRCMSPGPSSHQPFRLIRPGPPLVLSKKHFFVSECLVSLHSSRFPLSGGLAVFSPPPQSSHSSPGFLFQRYNFTYHLHYYFNTPPLNKLPIFVVSWEILCSQPLVSCTTVYLLSLAYTWCWDGIQGFMLSALLLRCASSLYFYFETGPY